MEINSRPLSLGGINTNYGYYKSRNVRFGANPAPDSFELTTLNNFTTEYNLKKAITENPKIEQILARHNVSCDLNMETIRDLQEHHAKDTKNIALGIIENLPLALKNKTDKNAVERAAFLHDTGKALIPEEILNKHGKLTEAETEIMHTHSELSYELLKNSGLDKKTLNLIKNHHQNATKTGYPFVDNNFFADVNQQIVSISDKYSALTEKRPYKEPLTEKQALTIIYKDVKDGKFNPLIFNSLVKYAGIGGTSEKITLLN